MNEIFLHFRLYYVPSNSDDTIGRNTKVRIDRDMCHQNHTIFSLSKGRGFSFGKMKGNGHRRIGSLPGLENFRNKSKQIHR